MPCSGLDTRNHSCTGKDPGGTDQFFREQLLIDVRDLGP